MRIRQFSFHFCIKLISIAAAAAWTAGRRFVTGRFDFPCDVATALCVANSIVLLLPVIGENVSVSLRFASAYSALAVIVSLFVKRGVAVVPVLVTCVILYLGYRAVKKYERVRALFRNDEVWKAVEENARWLYVSLYFLCCCFVLLAEAEGGGMWIAATAQLALYVTLLVRSYLGRTFYMGEAKEEVVKNIIKGTLRPVSTAASDEEDTARMGRLYDRAVRLMEEKRPFLREGYCLPEMASSLFSNKAYLSRTINVFSGRNFRQFVNYYRVNYSVELMKKDPYLRVTELASMSGFHNVVTYNMAFKLNMNETPSECLLRMRIKSGEPLSS